MIDIVLLSSHTAQEKSGVLHIFSPRQDARVLDHEVGCGGLQGAGIPGVRLKRFTMTELRTHRRVVHNGKKNNVPLSKLRTLEAVKTVVDHPRRLEELLEMLEDKDRRVRGRAAATLARLSESHPARLLRVIMRLKGSLVDESAYVRWHLAYTLGKLGAQFPGQSRDFLDDLVFRLEDENRIVRILSGKALAQLAAARPQIVEEVFRHLKKDIPPALSRCMRGLKEKSISI